MFRGLIGVREGRIASEEAALKLELSEEAALKLELSEESSMVGPGETALTRPDDLCASIYITTRC